MLFYRRFGLELRSSAKETADHLRHQLEFLHYLCRLEADAVARESDDELAAQIATARTEYSGRHLQTWVSKAASALEEVRPKTWPSAWMKLLCAWCQLDVEAPALTGHDKGLSGSS